MTLLALLLQADPERVYFKTGGAFFTTGTVLLVAIASAAALLGLLLLTMVVAPGVTSRCSNAIRERGIISFLAGGGVFIGFALLGAIGSRAPVVGVIGASGFLLSMVLGLAAASEDIGRRLYWIRGKEGSRAAHLASGWLVALGAACVPLIGWFLVIPYVALSGLGSIVVGAFVRPGPTAAPRDRVDMEIR